MASPDTEPWLDGFDPYYQREIAPLLDQLEQERQQARATARQRMLWVAPLVAIAGGLLWAATQNIQFSLFAVMAGAALGFWFVRAPLSEHSGHVKQVLVTRLCTFFGFSFEAKPVVSPVSRLRGLDLVPGYDRDSAEDRITGHYDGVDIELVELLLQQRRRSKNRTYYVTVFKGPVFAFSFPKRFSGRTVIRSDATFLGNWFTGLSSDGERVRLEDPEFERQFEVFGTDQVEARYLLTPGFMEAMLRLKRSLKTGVQAAFDGGQLFITANNHQDRFESDSWSQDETTADQVDRFVDEIGIVFRIIDELNLRSRTRL